MIKTDLIDGSTGTYDGSVTIGGIDLHCYTLGNGMRIIDMDGVNQLLAKLEIGLELSRQEMINLVELKRDRTVCEKVKQ